MELWDMVAVALLAALVAVAVLHCTVFRKRAGRRAGKEE